MKQTKILSVLLALSLLLSACSASAVSEPEAGMGLAIPWEEAVGNFSDVPAGAYYAEAANWGLRKGIFDPGLFQPDLAMGRAMVADALYRAVGNPAASGSSGFPDISAGSRYDAPAAWAAEQGLILGYADGTFGPENPVTREQMAAILWRYAGKPAAGTGEDFADEASISEFAKTAVDWARERGVIGGGEGNRFAPKDPLTRAHTAAILYRYLTGDGGAPSLGPAGNSPVVYMTADISPDGLTAVYKALNWTPGDHVAVKLSTGEPGSNYLRTDLIGDLVKSLDDPTIVECNTAYGGSRASTALHYQVAEDHGYTAIAKVDLMDEKGSMILPVTGGENLTENYVGANFAKYDSFLVLSHFKGHAMAGFGGAIKNISIGIASSEGKSHIHSGGSGGNMWSGDQDAFLESMAEAGKSVAESLDGKIVYINVMNRLSVDCDCDGSPAEPDMHDVGILASYDPVALDQACVDLVYAAKDGRSLINRMESRNGLHTLEHAEKIGLGSREYRLVRIDGDKKPAADHQVKMTVAGREYAITLYDNPSANDLYDSLPLELTFEDYNQTEKISYPPKTLTTEGMPDTFDPDVGDLCLYAPWGNLCIFYRDFRESTSLIPLGHVDSGMDVIGSMTENFTVTMEAIK